MDNKHVVEQVDDANIVEPSEAYTVRELVYRIACGMPVPASSLAGDYPEVDADFDDFHPTESPDFDLADYAAMQDELEARYAHKFVRKDVTPPTVSESTPEAENKPAESQE
ncbi:MAG: hypothetical protein L6V92_06085 [Phocaeicola vulgatus]|nr:MAG: hypothetical protein L6V92_06085 [Phocaeicola vulgatus]